MPVEERYKPFLLEFAGLKLVLDKFSDIIYRSPLELETDCQALRDVLYERQVKYHPRKVERISLSAQYCGGTA